MDYIVNNYRARKVAGKYFVTTDHGSYAVLGEEEMRKLKSGKIEGVLFDKLEEKEIVLTESNMGEAVRLLRNRNAHIMQGTSLHIIVPTLRCNMNCIYCHASSKNEKEKGFDMSIETAKKTVDFIFQSPSHPIAIEFQGGEPLLNWDIVKYIVEYAKEKNKMEKRNLDLRFVTNLTDFDEDKMNYLIDNDVSISTSLDGPKELHDSNRKYVKGSNYEQAVGWIKKIDAEYERRGIKRKRVGALVTLTKESLRYPKEIVDEYVSLGLRDIHLRFLNKLGIARNAQRHINYSSEEYMKFWVEAVRYIEELKGEGIEINERMTMIMANKIYGEYDPNYLELRSPCGAGNGQLVYNYDGDIYTCDEGRMVDEDLFHLGNVKGNKYSEVMTSDKVCAVVNASINDQYTCNDCVYKPYCGVCPVCNYSEQGSVVAKILETDRCKIYMAQFDWVVENKIMPFSEMSAPRGN